MCILYDFIYVTFLTNYRDRELASNGFQGSGMGIGWKVEVNSDINSYMKDLCGVGTVRCLDCGDGYMNLGNEIV